MSYHFLVRCIPVWSMHYANLCFIYFKFWNPGCKGGKNLQLLEPVNGEEDNLSKLLYVSYNFLVWCIPIWSICYANLCSLFQLLKSRWLRGKKNIQLLEHVNGEEDNVPNYCCTIFFLLSKLGIFCCVENLFMNEVY